MSGADNKYDGIKLTPRAALDDDFVKLCETVTAKRPRTVIDHILKHGIIDTDQLKQVYGYDHPPRAIGDVRENGIPLDTHKIRSETTGRKIGAYTFGDPKDIKHGRIGGRKAFSKAFKQALISKYGAADAFTGAKLHPRYLQIDHRIPYLVIGDVEHTEDVEKFLLIDASSQRAKSWSCENCKNGLEIHDPEICGSCYWAFPENYTHIAMDEIRRLDVVWQGNEISDFEALKEKAAAVNITPQEFIKTKLKD